MRRLKLGDVPMIPMGRTKGQTGELLQCGISTVDALIAEGTLRVFRIGKAVRVTTKSIDKLVNEYADRTGVR